MQSNQLSVDISKDRSSLVSKLSYWPDTKALCVYLRHGKPKYRTYGDVEHNHFEELCKAKSIGKMYLGFIKPNFKQVNYEEMSDAKKSLPTKNQASNETRFIKIAVNVAEINKDWLYPGEKGTYLSMTLHMKPDGELDKYGNLGMITQDVPANIVKAEKALPKAQKTKGNILGNAAEIDWASLGGSAPQPGANMGEPGLPDDVLDDLPF